VATIDQPAWHGIGLNDQMVMVFDSWSVGCYQVVTTWLGDCLRTGKPF